MSEIIDLCQFRLVRGTATGCICGSVSFLFYNGKPANDPESVAYYLCPRCDRIVKLGERGGEIRPSDSRVEPLEDGEIDPRDEEVYDKVLRQKHGDDEDNLDDGDSEDQIPEMFNSSARNYHGRKGQPQ